MVNPPSRQQQVADLPAREKTGPSPATVAEFFESYRQNRPRLNVFEVTAEDLTGLGLSGEQWTLWQASLDADSSRPPGPCVAGPETYLLLDGLLTLHRCGWEMPLTAGVIWVAALRLGGVHNSRRIGIVIEDDWLPFLARVDPAVRFTLGALCCAAGLSWAETGAALRTGSLPPEDDLRMMAALRGLPLPLVRTDAAS